jgi:hypothetical protein
MKRNPQEWKEGLSRLKNVKPFGGDRIENDKLWRRLWICYIDLADEEQEMFLDIACFFSEYNSKFDLAYEEQETFIDIAFSEANLEFETGLTIQKALQIWKVSSQDSSMSSLQNLKDRSLVKVNDKGNLVMHDQLHDMGRHIVKKNSRYESGNQSRIWDKEEAKVVLLNETVIPSSSNVHQSFNCTH